VPIARHYIGSGPRPQLTPDAEAALDFLDEIVNASEATATIDDDGDLSAFIQMDGVRGLSIHVAEGWRVVDYSGGPTRTPYPTEGQAVMSDMHRRGIWLDWRRGTPAPHSDG
jgi:hypothetical protein